MTQVFNDILLAIQNVGYLTFFVLVVLSLVLWRIHPILGLLAILLTFGLVAGII